jgi:hypothetical protein
VSFTVSESEAAAIRAAFDLDGVSDIAFELRRRLPETDHTVLAVVRRGRRIAQELTAALEAGIISTIDLATIEAACDATKPFSHHRAMLIDMIVWRVVEIAASWDWPVASPAAPS